jgi:hypothetical protein
MGIADERRLAELRYRSSRNRVIIRVIAYVSSIIPAILLFINFEAFREYAIVKLGGQPVVQANVVAEPKQEPVSRPQPEPRQNISRQAPLVPIRQTRVEARPVPVRRQPVRLLPSSAPQEVKPDFEITIDLSKSRQRYPIESTQVRVLPLDGATMSPREGVLDAQNPVTLTFSARFDPRITLTLDDNIWLTYEVESASGKLIPFTTTNLNSIRRKVLRNGKQAVASVARLEAEKAKVDTYLSASGGKLWNEKKAATIRAKQLPGLLAAARKRVNTLEVDLRAVESLIELANGVDGTKVGFVTSDRQLAAQ